MQGRREYGLFASQYVKEFHDKWIGGHAPKNAQLVGSADIQSLADLGNSYGLVRDMRIVPFSMEVVVTLVAATVVPLLPLTLTVIPLEAVVDRLIKVVFG